MMNPSRLSRRLIPAALMATVIVSTEAFCYQADHASTATLWRLSPEERVEQTRLLHNAKQAARIRYFIEDNANATSGCRVFLGDSNVEAFPVEQAFRGLSCGNQTTRSVAVNRGSSGERIEDVIERLDLCVRDLQPKELYLLIGSNDIWWVQTDYKDGNLGEGYERLVRSIKELSPQTVLYLHTLPPIDYRGDPFGAHSFEECRVWVDRANAQLREVAAKYGCRLIDLHALVSTPDGRMIRRYSTDGVHLSLLGYLRWLDEILPPGREKRRVWANLSGRWIDETSATLCEGAESPQMIYEKKRADWMREVHAGTLSPDDESAYRDVEQLRPRGTF